MLRLISAALVGTLWICGASGCVGSTSSDQNAADHVESDQATSFPILRTSPERVPRVINEVSEQSPYKLVAMQGQEVPSPIKGMKVWVLAGPKHLCLFTLEHRSGGVGATCRSVAGAKEDGLAITLLGRFGGRTPKRVIIGIAPQGSGAVVATIIADSAVTIPVEDGTFSRVDRILKPPDHFSLLRRPLKSETD